MKTYIISPSELSYLCNHCAYVGKNFNLYPKQISAGVTQTLDSMEKKYFLGDVKKIDKDIKKGETIDPFNISFFSQILKDDKNRSFRIKGKGDAIIKFEDGTSGIVDYKTSKFKEKNGKDYNDELNKKIFEYTSQLHCYSLLYSHLETDEKFLAENTRAKKPDSIKKSIEETQKKIKKISIKETSLLGLVFIYPEKLLNKDNVSVDFSHKFIKVKLDMKNFMKLLTKYLDMLHNEKLPEPTEDCKSCNYFISAGRIMNEK